MRNEKQFGGSIGIILFYENNRLNCFPLTIVKYEMYLKIYIFLNVTISLVMPTDAIILMLKEKKNNIVIEKLVNLK